MLPFKRPSAAPAALPILINPPRLYDPRPNGYSHVAVVTSPARFIYVAGQGGEDAAGELPPACTLIPVPRLALDGMCFEVEATAVQAVPTAARAD